MSSGVAAGDRHGDPARSRSTGDDTKRQVVRSQPRRQPLRITADLDPLDADGGDAVLDAGAARVVGVVDVPLDEERQTVGQGRVVGHEMPVEFHPVRPRAAHRQRLVAGPPGRGFDVVGPEAQRTGTSPTSASRRSHPRADGLVAASSRSTTAISSM